MSQNISSNEQKNPPSVNPYQRVNFDQMQGQDKGYREPMPTYQDVGGQIQPVKQTKAERDISRR